MSIYRLLGLVALTIGTLLLGFGLYSSQFIDQNIEPNTSKLVTREMLWYIISGIGLIIGGISILYVGKQKEKRP